MVRQTHGQIAARRFLKLAKSLCFYYFLLFRHLLIKNLSFLDRFHGLDRFLFFNSDVVSCKYFIEINPLLARSLAKERVLRQDLLQLLRHFDLLLRLILRHLRGLPRCLRSKTMAQFILFQEVLAHFLDVGLNHRGHKNIFFFVQGLEFGFHKLREC